MDHGYLDRVTHRRDLISQYPDTVHGYVPGGEAAVNELYDYLLTKYLPIRFPTMFRLSEDGLLFQNLVTGRSFPTRAPVDTKAALRNLGEIVEEELFLLLPAPNGHRLVAYICCFPSGFNPAEKLGQTLDGIHKPVPGYEKIGPSMERYFTKMEVGRPVKRINKWSVQDNPELFDCEANIRLQGAGPFGMENTFLRSEMQTLSRFPDTRAILFSFKTYMHNVAEVKEEGMGAQFAEAIEGLRQGNAPEMWYYKGATRWADRVCEYLRS
ncbi:hypothetical protein ACJ41O_010907 [Fusarium nematophilum]